MLLNLTVVVGRPKLIVNKRRGAAQHVQRRLHHVHVCKYLIEGKPALNGPFLPQSRDTIDRGASCREHASRAENSVRRRFIVHAAAAQ